MYFPLALCTCTCSLLHAMLITRSVTLDATKQLDSSERLMPHITVAWSSCKAHPLPHSLQLSGPLPRSLQLCLSVLSLCRPSQASKISSRRDSSSRLPVQSHQLPRQLLLHSKHQLPHQQVRKLPHQLPPLQLLMVRPRLTMGQGSRRSPPKGQLKGLEVRGQVTQVVGRGKQRTDLQTYPGQCYRVCLDQTTKSNT